MGVLEIFLSNILTGIILFLLIYYVFKKYIIDEAVKFVKLIIKDTKDSLKSKVADKGDKVKNFIKNRRS